MVSHTQPASASAAGHPAPVNGLLSVPASALQKGAVSASRSSVRSSAPRLKLLIRRLAPGLTRSEFEVALGDVWLVGAGKVDWLVYKPGRVSTEYAICSLVAKALLNVLLVSPNPLVPPERTYASPTRTT